MDLVYKISYHIPNFHLIVQKVLQIHEVHLHLHCLDILYQDIYGVTDVTVVSTGLNYDTDDIAEDNFGNKYSLTIDDGKIISATPINTVGVDDLVTIRINSENGLGAVLKPVLGILPPQEEVVQVIDCVS